MKSIVISLLIFTVAVVFISCQNEDQPTQKTSDEEWQLLSKKPKPGHNPDLEWIEFTGDLEGGQEVEGCCPNAGPSPDYTLTLMNPPFQGGIPGEHNGNIFMNSFGRNLPWAYKVQFWWTENDDETFIEVRGGVVQKDRKNKITTVTFTQDTCWIWYPDGQEEIVFVTFTLTRAKL